MEMTGTDHRCSVRKRKDDLVVDAIVKTWSSRQSCGPNPNRIRLTSPLETFGLPRAWRTDLTQVYKPLNPFLISIGCKATKIRVVGERLNMAVARFALPPQANGDEPSR